jgi:hypothetical protein
MGELADAFLFDDDGQIREVRYHEEPGKLGYRLPVLDAIAMRCPS